MKQIYHTPGYYPVEERIALIKRHMDEGLSFYQIAPLFGSCEQTIKYHHDRYIKPAPRFFKPYKKPTDVYKEYLVELHKAGLL